MNFVKNFPEITIKGVLADALYGTGDFMDQVKQITGGAQEISQLGIVLKKFRHFKLGLRSS